MIYFPEYSSINLFLALSSPSLARQRVRRRLGFGGTNGDLSVSPYTSGESPYTTSWGEPSQQQMQPPRVRSCHPVMQRQELRSGRRASAHRRGIRLLDTR